MTAFLNQLLVGDILLMFGVVSVLVSFGAYISYLRDMIVRRAKPLRAPWLIWSSMACIILCSQFYEGTLVSLWFVGVQAAGAAIIFALSISSGVGGLLNRADWLILAGAGVGGGLWYFTGTSAYALALAIGGGLAGGSASFFKAYRDPEGETMLFWLLSAIASICALISAWGGNPVLLAYPLCLLVLNAAVASALALGRQRLRRATVLHAKTRFS